MPSERRTPEVDFPPFIIADADTGHGGDAHVRNLIRRFVEAGVPGLPHRGPAAGRQEVRPPGRQVLVASDEQIKRLNAARFQLDIMRVPGLVVARTDAEAATLIDGPSDERDQPFILGVTNPAVPSYRVGFLAMLRRPTARGSRGPRPPAVRRPRANPSGVADACSESGRVRAAASDLAQPSASPNDSMPVAGSWARPQAMTRDEGVELGIADRWDPERRAPPTATTRSAAASTTRSRSHSPPRPSPICCGWRRRPPTWPMLGLRRGDPRRLPGQDARLQPVAVVQLGHDRHERRGDAALPRGARPARLRVQLHHLRRPPDRRPRRRGVPRRRCSDDGHARPRPTAAPSPPTPSRPIARPRRSSVARDSTPRSSRPPGRTAATQAMGAASTQHQHLVQIEAPPSLLERWL